MSREELDELLLFRQMADSEKDVLLFGPFGLLVQFDELPAELGTWLESEMFPQGRRTPATEFMGAFAYDAEEESLSQPDVAWRPEADAEELSAEIQALPEGWLDRVIQIRHSRTGESLAAATLEAHDWAVSRLVGGSAGQLELVRQLLRHGLLDAKRLRALLPTINAGDVVCRAARERLRELGG